MLPRLRNRAFVATNGHFCMRSVIHTNLRGVQLAFRFTAGYPCADDAQAAAWLDAGVIAATDGVKIACGAARRCLVFAHSTNLNICSHR